MRVGTGDFVGSTDAVVAADFMVQGTTTTVDFVDCSSDDCVDSQLWSATTNLTDVPTEVSRALILA